jgi:uncharacterized protein (DUF58 family)
MAIDRLNSTTLDLNEIYRYSGLEFLAKQVVEGFITGLHKSPFHGFSVEFAEHRLYNKGESTRHIDWKLYARTDKLFIKRYEEETNLRCRLVIDASSSMMFPEKNFSRKDIANKLVFSVYGAAAFIQMLKKQRDAAGLTIFDQQILLNTSARSSLMHQKMIYSEMEKLLADYQPEKRSTTNIAEALHTVAETSHRRSLVVIFSDMLEKPGQEGGLLSALQHLRHNKHEVILFHVTDQRYEQNLDFESGLYTFVDMESGEEIKLHPSQIKEHYQQQMSNYVKNLKLKCGQYRIDFVEADISKGLHQVLLPFLLKRSKMA